MTDGNERRTALRRKRTKLGVIAAGVLGLFGTLVVGVPEVLLVRATRQAKECLAKYSEPRGPETPSCGFTVQPFIFPAKVPWTANRARYRAEELGVRIAHYDYLDAAAGKPDRQALAHAADAIDHQAAVVQNGSTRVSFNDLGRSIGAPDPGRDADEIGDRQTLMERGEQWFNWRIRMSTLRAALLSGDFTKTQALAKRYAIDDPRDPDIRSASAAVLCMGSDTEKGMGFLAFIQNDRAARRYEALARDYGDVRVVLIACAAKAGKTPPPAPSKSDAGSDDAVEQRALLRLRLADPSGTDMAAPAAIAQAINLLEGGPRNPGARIALLASVLAKGAKLEASEVVRLSKPKFDELPFASPIAPTAIDWLAERRGIGDVDHPPIAPAATFVSAARAVEALVSVPEVESEDKPTDESKAENISLLNDLAAIRAALLLEATATFAREGNVDAGISAADEVVRLMSLDVSSRGLLRSNVYWLTGDRAKALAELELDVAPARDAAATNDRILAAVSMQRAELAMSLGKPDDARSAAERAERFATSANDPYFAARARWMLAAVGATKVRPPSKDKLASVTAFSSMGFGHPSNPWRRGDQDQRRALIDRVLAPWIGLASADPALRRAGRWAALDARGDAPPWLAVHLLLASRLLEPGEGDHEVWLDALLALDDRRFSLRQIAFARAEAARMRGDAAASKTWDERYRSLRKLAADPAFIELARHLDI